MVITQSPIWVTLLPAALGGLLVGSFTLLGSWITQRNNNRRERAAWAREDAARSYEYRSEAYVDFTNEFYHWHRRSVRDDVIPGGYEYLDPLLGRLTRIRIFGTNEAGQLANEAINTIVNFVDGDEETIPEVEDVLEPLWSEIRRDLSIPTSSRARDSAAQSRLVTHRPVRRVARAERRFRDLGKRRS